MATSNYLFLSLAYAVDLAHLFVVSVYTNKVTVLLVNVAFLYIFSLMPVLILACYVLLCKGLRADDGSLLYY